jgi:general secretion pathway protein I
MSPPHQHGFTLIEMVIAFAILGITLTVLFGVFQNALSRTRHDARLSEGTLLARSLLARAGSEWPLADGTREGSWGGYEYELIEQTVVAPPGQPPYTLPTIRVSASVTWVERAGRRALSLSTLKLLPPGAP